MTALLTEPRSNERSPPRPRLPTTIRSAPSAASMIASAASPSTSLPSTFAPPRELARSTARSNAQPASTRMTSRTVAAGESSPYGYDQA